MVGVGGIRLEKESRSFGLVDGELDNSLQLSSNSMHAHYI